MQMAALALREKVIPGVDHSVDLPSTYDVEELGVSNSHTISAFNESAYHPTVEELDVKLPASMKAQDILLPPPTAPDRFGFCEQHPVSQDVNNIHVFDDNNNMTSNENKKQEHPKMMEVPDFK